MANEVSFTEDNWLFPIWLTLKWKSLDYIIKKWKKTLHSSINKFKGIHIRNFHCKSQIDWLSLKLPWFFFNFLQPYSMCLSLLRNNTACVLAKILKKEINKTKFYWKTTFSLLNGNYWHIFCIVVVTEAAIEMYSNKICNHYMTVYHIQVIFLASNLLSDAFFIKNLHIQISCIL